VAQAQAQVDAPGRVSLWGILRESLHAWRRDLLYISLLAAVVEAPVVLAQLVYAHVEGELPGTDDGFSIDWDTVGVAFSAMLAHYFLAAVIETVEAAERHGHPRPTALDLIRRLPWLRLIVADVVLRAVTGVGFALLVVPGVLVGVYTVITLPLINLERGSVVDSIRRSVTLVRGHARTALGVWIIITVVPAVGGEALGEVGEAITHTHTGEYFGHLATEVVLLPLAALPVVMLAFDLVAARVGRSDRPPH
jgi:hypothetical protein